MSLRMKTVADMVKPGGRVCDIGCDHAFVSIYLVANGISNGQVIASDVRTKLCAIARR
ncbi:MAG: SAM-dependent methyltransferase [Coprococcus sp.]